MKQALPNLCHHSLVLSDFGGDANQNAEFRRQINVLFLLANFKQGLFDRFDFGIVGLDEVLKHVSFLFEVTLVKDVGVRSHVPSDGVHFVGSVRSVLRHNDGPFEFSVDLVLVKSLRSFLDQSVAVVN